MVEAKILSPIIEDIADQVETTFVFMSGEDRKDFRIALALYPTVTITTIVYPNSEGNADVERRPKTGESTLYVSIEATPIQRREIVDRVKISQNKTLENEKEQRALGTIK